MHSFLVFAFNFARFCYLCLVLESFFKCVHVDLSILGIGLFLDLFKVLPTVTRLCIALTSILLGSVVIICFGSQKLKAWRSLVKSDLVLKYYVEFFLVLGE